MSEGGERSSEEISAAPAIVVDNSCQFDPSGIIPIGWRLEPFGVVPFDSPSLDLAPRLLFFSELIYSFFAD
jgi:hypothetical protein